MAGACFSKPHTLTRAHTHAHARTHALLQSYGDTIRKYNIRAIPFLIFGLPGMGGPFRPEGTSTPIIINGSGDLETFLQVLETLWERSRSGAK